jgi:hypothetical protein
MFPSRYETNVQCPCSNKKYFTLTFERRMMEPREESQMPPKICKISIANVALRVYAKLHVSRD